MSIQQALQSVRRASVLAAAIAALPVAMLPSVAHADGISPGTFSATLAPGASTTITKTVTVSAGTPTGALVDVLFLTDTTGSMSPSITAVKSQFATIITDLAGLGNVAFGTAQYKDVGDGLTGPGAVNGTYKLDQNITTTTALVQAALNAYTAGGGGDTPESNLFSLDQAAGAGWRAGSARFIVWTGDVAGHDKLFGVDKAIALAALNAANIHVIGISQPSGTGLDVASAGSQTGQAGDIANGSAGQATFITGGTGGQFFASATASQIENIVKTAITSSFNTYSKVCIDSSGAPAGVTVAHAACITGSFDRSITRTFDFSTTFTGVTAGTYDFSILGTVDGATAGTELDHIVVTGVPEPETYAMMLAGLGLLGFMARRRRAN
jgi:hypothetical protein